MVLHQYIFHADSETKAFRFKFQYGFTSINKQIEILKKNPNLNSNMVLHQFSIPYKN